MTRPIRPLAIVAALAFLLSACDATAPDLGSPEGAAAAPHAASFAAPVSGVDGRLVFTSQTAFDQVYADYAAKSVDDTKAFTASYGVVSMRAAEEQDAEAIEAGKHDPGKARMSVVEDPTLAALLSPAGVVQIGATVYKVGPTQVFEGGQADAATFQSRSESELAGAPFAKTAIGRSADTAPAYSRDGLTGAESKAIVDARCAAFTGTNNATYRLCGESYITNWKFVKAGGAATHVLKRGSILGITYYYPVKGDQLSMTSTHRLAFDGSPLPAAQTTTSSNTRAWLLFRVYKPGTFFTPHIYGSIQTTHRTTHAGRSATVSTSVSRASGGPV